MEFLKEKLGDKYEEFMGLIGEDVKLKVDDGEESDEHMIPKSRFDEVNGKYKDMKRKLKAIENDKLTDEEKFQNLIDETEEAKLSYLKELSKLEAMKIFVDAGLEEDDYSEILEDIVTEDKDRTSNLAKKMVGIIDMQKQLVEKKVKSDLMENTPKPPKGEDNEGDLSIGEKIAKAKNEISENLDNSVWD